MSGSSMPYYSLHRAKMAKFMRGCPTPWSQGNGTTEPEARASILSSEKLEDILYDKVVADYKSKASEPNVESYAQEKEVDSDVECTAMELPKMGL